MKTKIMMTSLLLLSAVGATPALANYFYNPHVNIMLNVGSAPSPTPRDIREHRLPHVANTDHSHIDGMVADATKNSGTSGKTAQTYAQVGERRNVTNSSPPH